MGLTISVLNLIEAGATMFFNTAEEFGQAFAGASASSGGFAQFYGYRTCRTKLRSDGQKDTLI